MEVTKIQQYLIREIKKTKQENERLNTRKNRHLIQYQKDKKSATDDYQLHTLQAGLSQNLKSLNKTIRKNTNRLKILTTKLDKEKEQQQLQNDNL